MFGHIWAVNKEKGREEEDLELDGTGLDPGWLSRPLEEGRYFIWEDREKNNARLAGICRIYFMVSIN